MNALNNHLVAELDKKILLGNDEAQEMAEHLISVLYDGKSIHLPSFVEAITTARTAREVVSYLQVKYNLQNHTAAYQIALAMIAMSARLKAVPKELPSAGMLLSETFPASRTNLADRFVQALRFVVPSNFWNQDQTLNVLSRIHHGITLKAIAALFPGHVNAEADVIRAINWAVANTKDSLDKDEWMRAAWHIRIPRTLASMELFRSVLTKMIGDKETDPAYVMSVVTPFSFPELKQAGQLTVMTTAVELYNDLTKNPAVRGVSLYTPMVMCRAAEIHRMILREQFGYKQNEEVSVSTPPTTIQLCHDNIPPTIVIDPPTIPPLSVPSNHPIPDRITIVNPEMEELKKQVAEIADWVAKKKELEAQQDRINKEMARAMAATAFVMVSDDKKEEKKVPEPEKKVDGRLATYRLTPPERNKLLAYIDQNGAPLKEEVRNHLDAVMTTGISRAYLNRWTSVKDLDFWDYFTNDQRDLGPQRPSLEKYYCQAAEYVSHLCDYCIPKDSPYIDQLLANIIDVTNSASLGYPEVFLKQARERISKGYFVVELVKLLNRQSNFDVPCCQKIVSGAITKTMMDNGLSSPELLVRPTFRNSIIEPIIRMFKA
jgi:hypothetical protein